MSKCFNYYIILLQFQEDCLEYKNEYNIDTICVNHDEKIDRAQQVQKLHPTMICQVACHILHVESFGFDNYLDAELPSTFLSNPN